MSKIFASNLTLYKLASIFGPGAKEAFCVVPAYPVTLQNKSYKGTDANDRPSIPKAKRKT